MKNLVVLISACFIQLTAHSQDQHYLNKKEVLVANDVYRVDEYDALDSTSFMEKFPNGRYSIFNEEGLVIKSNNYQLYVVDAKTNRHDEYINYFFYDEDDNSIGFIQMFTEGDEPFRTVYLKSLSEDQKTTRLITVEPSPLGTEIEVEQLKSGSPRPITFKDTVKLTERHSRSIGAKDSSLVLDIYYSETGHIDSTIFFTKCYLDSKSSDCYNKCIFFYNDQGKITSKRFESHSYNSDTNPYIIRTVKYNELGLLESIENRHLNPDVSPELEIRKFVYTFRSDN